MGIHENIDLLFCAVHRIQVNIVDRIICFCLTSPLPTWLLLVWRQFVSQKFFVYAFLGCRKSHLEFCKSMESCENNQHMPFVYHFDLRSLLFLSFSNSPTSAQLIGILFFLSSLLKYWFTQKTRNLLLSFLVQEIVSSLLTTSNLVYSKMKII